VRRVAQLLIGCIVFWSSAGAQKPAGVWLDVPFVAQEKNGCGSASLSMVMKYWFRTQGKVPGERADASKIQEILYLEKAKGIFASDMTRYLEENGFRTFPFKGSLADVREHLSKGRPLIVALMPSERKGSRHYVVVVGLNWRQEFVLVNDPAQRKLTKRTQEGFEKEWNAADNWTLLALPGQAE
jgi:ABC-type bacteriocin/lantibiotic exporter with double-glycine peptidase domain